MPQLPPDAPTLTVRCDPALTRIIRASNNGKAAGPSGWNGAMLAVLADHEGCRQAIARLLEDIINGRVPHAVRAHITATRLIALAKPNGKVRPIAMGELLYRMAAAYAVRSVSDEARAALAPHQYGVGVPGGCEHIVHAMQHELTYIAPGGKPLAAVKVDIANAFNTCQRPLLLRTLFASDALSPLHRIAHWAYSQPTLLLPQCKGEPKEEHTIESVNGVRQGDPLSSLLFCLYMQPALDKLVADPRFAGRISVYAYVDDVHIIGELDDVATAFATLKRLLSDIDLSINPAKCSLVYLHSRSTDTGHHLTNAHTHLLADAGLDWAAGASNDAADVLGAVVGITAEAITQRLNEQHGGADGLFGTFIRRVSAGGLSVQAAMLLLARAMGKLAYLQRCLPPAAMHLLAAEWDSMLLTAACTVLDLADREVTEDVKASLRRPLSQGGFGLSSAVFVSPFAFIASVAQSAAQPGDHPLSAATLPSASLLHQWLTAAMTSAAVQACPLQHHTDVDTFTGHYHADPSSAARLQHRLVSATTNTTFSAEKTRAYAAVTCATTDEASTAAKRGLARLYGCAAKHACRWKTVEPTEPEYCLSDEHYRISARRDLSLRPNQDCALPRRCSACGVSTAADGLHGQRCVYSGRWTRMRHDSIELQLHRTVRESVGSAYRQQRGLPGAARTIPDLLITLDNRQLLCDVVVVDPLADSHLDHSSIRPLAAAEQAAAKKKAKYQQVAQEMAAVHLPFAVETTGGLSRSALDLVRDIHHSARSQHTWRDADKIGSHLLDCVAVAVQRCSAMAVVASMRREAAVVYGRDEV